MTGGGAGLAVRMHRLHLAPPPRLESGTRPLCGPAGDCASRATVARVRLAVVAALALVLAACGGKPHPTLADCLNDAGFLVRGSGKAVSGTSPGGVAFSVTLYPDASVARSRLALRSPRTALRIGRAVVDWHGNPSPSSRLRGADLDAVGRCVGDTVGSPAAR